MADKITPQLGQAFMDLEYQFRPLPEVCARVRNTKDWRHWTFAEVAVIWKVFQLFQALQDRGLVEMRIPKHISIQTMGEVMVRRVPIEVHVEYSILVLRKVLKTMRGRGLGMGGNVVRLEERRQSA